MAPKLYMAISSPVVRAVLMCAKAIDLELELVGIDPLKNEHLSPNFLKINPLHTIPTLDDNGFILCDSHAIMTYLIGKYAKDKSLYPEDLERRALIDQKLFFHSSVLFARHIHICLPIIYGETNTVLDKDAAKVQEAYGHLETFLKDQKYVAGDSLSIADFSLINTISNASVVVPLDDSKYPNISSWRKRMQTLPYYGINEKGNKIFKIALEKLLSK